MSQRTCDNGDFLRRRFAKRGLPGIFGSFSSDLVDSQFANKSKENVDKFAWKYDIPIPWDDTVVYDKDESI